MLFLHGWPDQSALWANQFEAFCAPPHGKYYCVAPSWYDFHPDVPPRPQSDLLWDSQVDAFHSVVLSMDLTNITFVIFDFGSVMGYIYAYKYPERLKAMVSMDIGMGIGPPSNSSIDQLAQYQQINIEAFRTDNTTMEQENALFTPCGCGLQPPPGWMGAAAAGRCPCLQSITSNWAWPYTQLVNNTKWAGISNIPTSEWKYSLAPDFPSLPLLFLWGKCDIGTGSGWGKPCKKRDFLFFGQDFVHWVSHRGLHSQVVALDGAGHWTQCKVPNTTNAAIQNWLAELE